MVSGDVCGRGIAGTVSDMDGASRTGFRKEKAARSNKDGKWNSAYRQARVDPIYGQQKQKKHRKKAFLYCRKIKSSGLKKWGFFSIHKGSSDAETNVRRLPCGKEETLYRSVHCQVFMESPFLSAKPSQCRRLSSISLYPPFCLWSP